jgi:tetratricopeptide (TPR) repeat protein
MAKRRKDELEEPIVNLGEVSGQAQDFFERNQQMVIGVVGGVALLVVGFFAYQSFYKAPRQIESVSQLHKAELVFQQDSFQKSLLDPGGGFPGFIDMADQYGNTKSGNLANYYSGISFLRLGDYEKAIRYLNQYDAKDDMTKAMKYGMLGDSYSELQKFDKAVSNYKKAASASGDELTAPYFLKKAGMLLEKQGNAKAALAQYEKIKTKFYNTEEGRSIEKYIARVQ